MVKTLSVVELQLEMARTKALLEGHFLLSSGLHSPKYLQCARLLQFPDLAERIGASLAALFGDLQVDVVAAPAIGGILVAQELARALGTRAVFSEREGPEMTFRRGLEIDKGERVVVVEDVITTGGSIRETMDAARRRGAEVVGAGCIVDRSGGKTDFGMPIVSLIKFSIPTYTAEACPLCKDGLPLVKPGSRKPAP
jgi:orotate phosphoribosyltransferase